ncbi:MAG: hypothetical protein ACTHMY_18715 [Solirubrobacteraceae bacterium]
MTELVVCTKVEPSAYPAANSIVDPTLIGALGALASWHPSSAPGVRADAKAITRLWTCPGLRDTLGLVVDVDFVVFEPLLSTA